MDIMETKPEIKRGRGRPPKPKQPIDPKNPLDVIKQPKRTDLAPNVQLPEGDNNKFTTFALAIMKLPKINVREPRVRIFRALRRTRYEARRSCRWTCYRS